jgi:hypothetical protein
VGVLSKGLSEFTHPLFGTGLFAFPLPGNDRKNPMKVWMDQLVNFAARGTFSAGIVFPRLVAHQPLGISQGQRQFSRARRSSKELGVGYAAAFQTLPQEGFNPLLPGYIGQFHTQS